MTDLGTVDGDSCSLAFSVNAAKQIVGVSVPGCDFGQSRAVIWDGNSIADLNTLIPPGSSLYLTVPETINDRGEIAGIGLDSVGNQHAFLLVPCNGGQAKCQDEDQSTIVGAPVFHIMPRSSTLSIRGGTRRAFRKQHYSAERTRTEDETPSFSDGIAFPSPNACTRSCGFCSGTHACSGKVSGCARCGSCEEGRARYGCWDVKNSRFCYKYVKCSK
jgi:hypothetical protein